MPIAQKLDHAQKRSKVPSIAVATWKKFQEDRSTNLASMIAFWAFFSIFPLFLVLVTVMAWLLSSADRSAVLGHVAKMLPLLDPSTVNGLTGAWWAFVIGLFTALWSGTGAVRAAQFAFDSVWEVPYHERPGLVKQTLRSGLVLLAIGAAQIATTVLSGLVASSANGVHLGVIGRVAGYVLAAALDVAIFIIAFRVLTVRANSVREVLPGALLAGGAFFVLQELPPSSFLTICKTPSRLTVTSQR